jgi:hypothetical protein
MAIRPLRDMLVAMTETDIQSKLTEYEDMVRLLTTKCEELVAENARLRSSENTAHSVLREVYIDPSASPHVRVLAAKAAISHESAPLKPISQLELKAEEPVRPLSEIVAERRARADAWCALPLAERERMVRGVVRDGNGGNGDNTAGS